MDAYKGLASLGLIATAILWGGNHVVIRFIAEQSSPFALVFWRWSLCVLVLFAFSILPLWRIRMVLRARIGSIFVLGFINCILFSLAIIAAPFGTTAANVGLIQATAPLWVTLGGLLFANERLDLGEKAGLLLGFGGTCMLVLSGQEGQPQAFSIRWGDGAALIATLLWAVYSMMLRKSAGIIPPVLQFCSIVLAGYLPLLFGTVVAVQIGIVENPLYQISSAVWWPLLYIGLGATLLGNLFWNYGVHILGAGLASQFLFLAPLCSIFFGALWLDELPTAPGWFGALIVLVGLICSTFRKAR